MSTLTVKIPHVDRPCRTSPGAIQQQPDDPIFKPPYTPPSSPTASTATLKLTTDAQNLRATPPSINVTRTTPASPLQPPPPPRIRNQ
nr:unnamed protein product [Spirometra erinaceieuropaei]